MRGKLFCTGMFVSVALLVPAMMGGCPAQPGQPVSAVSITTQPVDPAAPVANATFTVVFNENVTGFTNPQASVEIQHNGTSGGQVTITAVDNKTYKVTVTGVTGQGTFTLVVPAGAATDALGNPSPAASSDPIAVDTVAPQIVAVTSSTPDGQYKAGANINIHLTFSESVTLTGGVLNVTLNTGHVVAIQPFAGAAQADGTYTVQAGDNTVALDCTAIALAGGAAATDAAGNPLDVSLPASKLSTVSKIVVDTTAPVVTVNALTTNDATPALTGTVNDSKATITVTVSGKTYTATNNGNGTWTLADNTISPALTTGTYDVSVTATDAAGNVGHDATTNELTIDATSPVVTVDSLLTRDTTPPLSGHVDDPAATIAVTVGGKTYAAVNNGNGTWTLPDNTISPALADGQYDVAVAATDAVGNVGRTTAAKALVIDTTPPVVAIDPLVSKDRRPVLTGTVDDTTATVMVSIDTGAAGTATNNGNGTWAFTATSDVADGVHDVAATATDGAGNSASATLTGGLTVDTIRPVVTVNPLTTPDSSPLLDGTVVDATATTVKVTVGGQTYDATVAAGTWTLAQGVIAPLLPGTYDVTVVATDAAGNQGNDPGTGALVVTGAPTVTAAILAPDNSYLDITFDRPVYGDAGHSLPVTVGSFVLTYTRNDDPITAVTIGSVTAPDGSALVGGETMVRLNLSLVGGPSEGLGMVSVDPAADSIYSSLGVAATGTGTGDLRLNDPANLLAPYDWSFETFNDVAGPDWNPTNAGSSFTYVHSGVESVKFANGTPAWTDRAITMPNDTGGTQFIDVGAAAGTKFRISAWVYVKANTVGIVTDTGQRLQLKMELAAGGFVTEEANFTVPAYDTWTQIVYTDFTPAGITGHAWATFETRALSPNDNDVFVDDMRVTLP